ncbi:MAG: class I SAM-dependent methyltransferase [Thermodesulfobacteriota bacterium]
MERLTPQDFARSFGCAEEDFSKECLDLIAKKDFRFQRVQGLQRDAIILEVLQRIDSDTQKIGAQERREVWFRGWEENLKAFVGSGYDVAALTPKFLREKQPVRFAGDYIVPHNPAFELDFITVFRTWLYQQYFQGFPSVYEFGCGTGFNLLLLGKMLQPEKMYGLDFVQSSVDLVNKIGEAFDLPLEGRAFDMIHPDHDFKLKPGSLMFTFGALEQLAGKFHDFIHYILDNRPDLCIHIEPTVELYDETKLFDYLAIKFHRKRGYTTGLLPYLQKLAQKQKIKLLKVKRLGFGSLFMEGYTYMIWQPV